MEIVRTATPPIIDGVLDDAVWADAAVIENLRQVVPIEDADPTQPTEIRVLFDENAMYFGIRCYDSDPQAIIATQLRRDGSLDADDRIELVIDPFFDRRNGFFFAVNPVGAKVDGLVVENTQLLRNWDGIWYAKATRDDQGWVAEI
ncbi:MAG: carbohydrate binding family 9 domain-containing protein, partial [Nitrospinae bacterium]|nr:carbohydrate binding family 9 domain-containing protein [Nitrospinota bacterium]